MTERTKLDDLPDVLDSKDVARVLPFSVDHVRVMLARGDIPSRRWGRKRLVLKRDLLKLLESAK
jgi:excisionase family DNA binding protein